MDKTSWEDRETPLRVQSRGQIRARTRTLTPCRNPHSVGGDRSPPMKNLALIKMVVSIWRSVADLGQTPELLCLTYHGRPDPEPFVSEFVQSLDFLGLQKHIHVPRASSRPCRHPPSASHLLNYTETFLLALSGRFELQCLNTNFTPVFPRLL